MKKILALVMCAALLFVLAIPAMAAPITITAPKGTPSAIDGVKDDVYSDFIELAFVNQPDGAGGRIAVAWDDDNLYFYVIVDDTTPFHDNDTDWQTDNVEFFIDWNNHKSDQIQNDDQPFWQARIHSAPGANAYGITAHANERWNPSDFEAITFVVVPKSGADLSNGYIIEAAFPRSAVEGGMTLTEGKVLGFDVTISDAHDDFDRYSTAFFFDHDAVGMEGNMWQNPSALKALLVLGAAPPPPVVVEEAPAVVDAPAPVVAAPVAPAPAPATADPVSLIVLGSIISAAGVIIAKKRK